MHSPQQLNPNLTSGPVPTTSKFGYRDIIVKKLVNAVACSVISQLVLLVIYVFMANINIFHPIRWMTSTLNTFTYISTWFFVILFSGIMFAQCLICAKDYVLMSSYCSTRFQQFVRIFSLHNFTLLSLHCIIGAALVWLILSLVDGAYKDLVTGCDLNYCLVADTFFLIVGGLWTGFYFFVSVYISSKHLTFPVIQQKKFLQFRTSISPLLKDSFRLSLKPTIYYILIYYFYGNILESRFANLFGLSHKVTENSILIYMYSWLFSALYYFSMNLMRIFFYLFLTEAVQFPLIKNSDTLTLSEAIVMDGLPIVQNLACLDLFLMAQWAPHRRQVFYQLSQPGGHPHNWNALIDSVLKLFSDYTDLLKRSTVTEDNNKRKNQQPDFVPFSPLLQSPISPINNYPGLRNLRTTSFCDYQSPVDVSHTFKTNPLESLQLGLSTKLAQFTNFLKVILGIEFLFGELPQGNIQKCLANGHLIIWATQGIAQLSVSSLVEDNYGIVQKDLPVIISSLVEMKLTLDKLNKVPSLTRKASLNDCNNRMKAAVTGAVKRALFNIYLNFGKYFDQLPLSQEVVQYMQVNCVPKSCA